MGESPCIRGLKTTAVHRFARTPYRVIQSVYSRERAAKHSQQRENASGKMLTGIEGKLARAPEAPLPVGPHRTR